MTISVIIPVYNDALRLEWCLESLCRQSIEPDEVILVNDGGDYIGMVNSYKGRLPLKWIDSGGDEDFRAGCARNDGVRQSHGEILVFIDCDCILPADGIASHVRNQWRYVYGQKAPYLFSIGNRYHWPQESVRAFKGGFSYEELLKECRVDPSEGDSTLYFRSFNLCVAAEFFCALGGFDETFSGWGYEDVELGRRAKRWHKERGTALLTVKSGLAIHADHPKRATHQSENTGEDLALRKNWPVTANGGPLKRMK